MDIVRYGPPSNHPSGCQHIAGYYCWEGRDDCLEPLHQIDYYSMQYAIEGEVIYHLNGQQDAITTGDLLFVRPVDTRAFYSCGRNSRFEYIDVEFTREAWFAFTTATGFQEEAQSWDLAPTPPRIKLPLEERKECLRAFERIAIAYMQSPDLMGLHRFLASVIPYLRRIHVDNTFEPDVLKIMPRWLAVACRRMAYEWWHLPEGVSKMVELSNVSHQHLWRTLKQYTNMTPTEFVNKQRMAHAARFLTTTSRGIADIALECGFDNLSYFYRLFRKEYGKSPHQYRMAERKERL